MPAKTERWFFRCIRGCKKSWAVDFDCGQITSPAKQAGYYSRATACPHCGHVPQEAKWCKGLIEGHRVMGKVLMGKVYDVSLRPPCDGRCTNAQGPSCECQCGGANHGSQKLVEHLTEVKGVQKELELCKLN